MQNRTVGSQAIWRSAIKQDEIMLSDYFVKYKMTRASQEIRALFSPTRKRLLELSIHRTSCIVIEGAAPTTVLGLGLIPTGCICQHLHPFTHNYVVIGQDLFKDF